MGMEEDIAAIKAAVQDIRGDNKSTLQHIAETVGNVLGVVSNLSGVFSLVSVLPTLVQFFKGADPTMEALNRIDQLLHFTYDFEQAQADLTQMHEVTAAVVTCRSALSSLIEETPPFSAAALDSLQTTTRTQVDLLESDPYWMRVFFSELLFSDFWFGVVQPPHGDITPLVSGKSYVFDYRLTLMGYANAVSTRTSAILLLLANNFIDRQQAIDEVSRRADTLEKFMQRIVNGFVSARTPRFMDVSYLDESIPSSPPNPPLWQSNWDILGFPGTINFPVQRPFGVISSHDGNGIEETYPATLFPNTTVGPFGLVGDPNFGTETYYEFVARYQLGNRKRAKALYLQVGLDQAWIAVQDLRRLAGQSPEVADPMQCWSMRDIYQDLGKAAVERNDDPRASGPPLSMVDIIRRLAVVGNVDNSHELAVSLRTALETATA